MIDNETQSALDTTLFYNFVKDFDNDVKCSTLHLDEVKNLETLTGG